MLWGETLTHTECWGLMGVFQQNQHLQPDWFFWRLAALLARYRSMRICASLAPCQPSKYPRHLVNVISRRLLRSRLQASQPWAGTVDLENNRQLLYHRHSVLTEQVS